MGDEKGFIRVNAGTIVYLFHKKTKKRGRAKWIPSGTNSKPFWLVTYKGHLSSSQFFQK